MKISLSRVEFITLIILKVEMEELREVLQNAGELDGYWFVLVFFSMFGGGLVSWFDPLWKIRCWAGKGMGIDV